MKAELFIFAFYSLVWITLLVFLGLTIMPRVKQWEIDILVARVLLPNGKEEYYTKWSDTPSKKYPFSPTSTYCIPEQNASLLITLYDRHYLEFTQSWLPLSNEHVMERILWPYHRWVDHKDRPSVAHLHSRYVTFQQNYRLYGEQYHLTKLERYYMFSYYCLLKSLAKLEPYNYSHKYDIVKYSEEDGDDQHRYLLKDYWTLCECLFVLPSDLPGF